MPDPLSLHRIPTGGDLLALDHVALTVADPGAMEAFLCDHLGMRELLREPDVVVLGAGSGAAPLSLVRADGARDGGALERLILRVADVERAVAALPAGTAVEGDRFERATFAGPEGLGLGFTLVAGGGIDYDFDHLILRVSDPEQTRIALAEIGCVPRGNSLHVADKSIVLHASPAGTERPLLGHLGIRVESVDAVASQVRERGLAVDERTPAGALTIVLPGPEQIRVRFVEPVPHNR